MVTERKWLRSAAKREEEGRVEGSFANVPTNPFDMAELKTAFARSRVLRRVEPGYGEIAAMLVRAGMNL